MIHHFSVNRLCRVFLITTPEMSCTGGSLVFAEHSLVRQSIKLRFCQTFYILLPRLVSIIDFLIPALPTIMSFLALLLNLCEEAAIESNVHQSTLLTSDWIQISQVRNVIY